MELSEVIVNDSASTPPKNTAVAPVKPLPLRVTSVPPAVLPEDGLTPLMLGAETVLYVKWSAEEVEDVAA